MEEYSYTCTHPLGHTGPVTGKLYQVFPGGKVGPGRAADHSPPSSAAVMEQYSYTCTHPLGHTGPVTGKLYLFFNFYSYKMTFRFLGLC